MTHDQIDRLVRRANPLPDPNVLTPVDVPVLTTERRMEMQTDDRVMAGGGGRSRSRGPLIGIATAALILVAGLVLFLTRDDTPVAQPAPNAAQLPEVFGPVEPGAYYADPDNDGATSLRGTFVIDEAGWLSLAPNGAEINDSVSLLVVEVDEVYTTACNSIQGPVAAESTAAGLANQFAANGFIVREASTPISAFGYDGYKLVMEVPPGCADEADQVWNGGSFGGRYYQESGQVLEYWFLDVEGTPVMVEATWADDTPEEDLAELRDVLDTLVITP
jgi:hypothetical protein